MDTKPNRYNFKITKTKCTIININLWSTNKRQVSKARSLPLNNPTLITSLNHSLLQDRAHDFET